MIAVLNYLFDTTEGMVGFWGAGDPMLSGWTGACRMIRFV